MLSAKELLEMVELGIISMSSAVSFIAWRLHIRNKKKDLKDKGFSKRKWNTWNKDKER